MFDRITRPTGHYCTMNAFDQTENQQTTKIARQRKIAIVYHYDYVHKQDI